ncbi:MAG: hypothetical protein IKE15_11285 [Clostridia bacterium]|nr:hypothetical protein [Clostridia bacterium]
MEVQFLMADDLFTHEANGDMVFHPEVRDSNGAPFPFTFPGALIGPGAFACPYFSKE